MKHQNVNRLFVTLAHFGAVISHYTTICYGYLLAGPMYGTCPYQLAEALNTFMHVHAENAQKTVRKGDNFHQDMDSSQLSYHFLAWPLAWNPNNSP